MWEECPWQGADICPSICIPCSAGEVDQCLAQQPWQSAVNKDAESKQEKHLKRQGHIMQLASQGSEWARIEFMASTLKMYKIRVPTLISLFSISSHLSLHPILAALSYRWCLLFGLCGRTYLQHISPSLHHRSSRISCHSQNALLLRYPANAEAYIICRRTNGSLHTHRILIE